MVGLLILLGYCLGCIFLMYFLLKKATTNEKGVMDKSSLGLVIFLVVFGMSFVTFLFGGLLLWNELYML